MPKSYSVYICQQCGFKSSSYLGKCPQCDSWNSFVETLEKGEGERMKGKGEKAEIIDLSKIQQTDYRRLDTGFEELDRCLGGGIVTGSLVLVSGDPGIGKSTLLTQLALNIDNSSRALYVAGEESARQIKIRTDRIAPNKSLSVLNETDVDAIISQIKQFKPGLVVIDSIQTLETRDLISTPGSISQVRECAHRLQRLAKALHIPLFLVGHVTKEGNLAGPKTLEHMVDVVLSLEGDSSSLFRIVRATKNRFGPTDEVGVFEMKEQGMMEVKNPSKFFLDNKAEAPGSAVTVILTGVRPILVEIQALVTKTSLPVPRKVAQGIDHNRLQLLAAVLQKRMGLPLWDQDIFVNVTSGLKIYEPAADLAICMSVISSFTEKVLGGKTIFIGEVGLLGELRVVRQLDKRETEAKKLGFNKIISPKNAKNLSQALKLAGL